MGKQGPCYHCGVTSTPLWRNGPPDKPVLCNACGSRWRTKGTLANYTPLHVRVEPDELEDYKVSKVKSSSIRIKEAKLQKRKQIHDNIVVQGYKPEYDINFEKVSEDDSSHRSSSGSTISHTEGCAQYGGIDARDFAGSAQSVLWDTIVPSRKRTCVSNPRPSPIEKLTKDLHCILHEQQSSYLSGSSEEDLLFESETPWMDSVEMGHGSVLIRHPNSGVQEEESEASSFSMDNKRHLANEIHLGSAAIASNTDDRDVSFPSLSLDKLKKPTEPGTQHELMESLESMFDNPQFEESLSSFNELLAEGIFDPSFLGANVEDYKTLKRIALTNLTESKWIEHYNLLKDVKHEKATEGEAAGGPNVLASSNKVPIKRPFDGHSQNFSEPLALVKSP